jgi:sulfate transport system permease protein
MTPAAAASTLPPPPREFWRGGPFPGTYLVVLLYLVGVVGLPVGLVAARALDGGAGRLAALLADPEADAAFSLSFRVAFAVAIANAFLGTATAYALVRLRFPGRALLDAMVDLPLALPTAVTGLALAAIVGPASPLGPLLEAAGLPILYRPAGVYLAVLAVTLPFTVRAVQPVLLDLDPAEEEAAATLGAGGLRTFVSVVLPAIRPAILAGAALTFGRALGEFGAVIFVAGTTPFRTQVAPTLVYARLEAHDLDGASAAALVVLAASFALLGLARLLERRTARRSA